MPLPIFFVGLGNLAPCAGLPPDLPRPQARNEKESHLPLANQRTVELQRRVLFGSDTE